jgi:hypothetical protein
VIGSGGIGNGVIWSGHSGRLSNIMKSLKNLLSALALLIASALVIGALAYCFAQFFIGGAL